MPKWRAGLYGTGIQMAQVEGHPPFLPLKWMMDPKIAFLTMAYPLLFYPFLQFPGLLKNLP